MYCYRVSRRPLTPAEVDFGARVGAALRERRRSLGISGGDLAVASNVSLDAIRSIESGRVGSPGLWVASRLATALSLSLDTLSRDAMDEAGRDTR